MRVRPSCASSNTFAQESNDVRDSVAAPVSPFWAGALQAVQGAKLQTAT